MEQLSKDIVTSVKKILLNLTVKTIELLHVGNLSEKKLLTPTSLPFIVGFTIPSQSVVHTI